MHGMARTDLEYFEMSGFLTISAKNIRPVERRISSTTRRNGIDHVGFVAACNHGETSVFLGSSSADKFLV
jgi:hypothetical protein